VAGLPLGRASSFTPSHPTLENPSLFERVSARNNQEGAMKNPRLMKTSKIMIAAIAFASLAFLWGCGGGGGGSTQSILPVQPASQDDGAMSAADVQIPYDVDVEVAGRTADRAAYDAAAISNYILAMRDGVEALPAESFVQASTRSPKDFEIKRKRLLTIIKDITNDVRRNNFKQAYTRTDKKLIPRVDGCAGGNSNDDYLANCADKQYVLDAAADLKALLKSGFGRMSNIEKRRLRTAVASILTDLKSYVSGISAGGGGGTTGDPKAFLMSVLTTAANYALDGALFEMKDVLSANFVPYVDGVGTDDLILLDEPVRIDLYNKAIAIMEEVKVSSITIVPEENEVSVNGVVNFTAECTFMSGNVGDCTSRVTWVVNDPAIGTISAQGAFTGAVIGTTTVHAEYPWAVSNEATVIVIR